MSARSETAQRRATLSSSLRGQCRDGSLTPGDLVPPLRELAARHGLSLRVANQELQRLVELGVLYTVPRVGTFVGAPRVEAFEFFVLLFPRRPEPGDHYTQLQAGFEEHIAHRGGASLVMTQARALEARSRGELPPIAGVFNFGQHPRDRGWGRAEGEAQVNFGGMVEDPESCDVVTFDDVDGGRRATQHLLALRHRRIAFLGVHRDEAAATNRWSREREDGWRQALAQAGADGSGLAFHPRTDVISGKPESVPVMRHAARPLVQQLVAQPSVTGVVAANDVTALCLFDALREAQVPHARWPAVVGFDNSALVGGFVLTSLRLPWEEVGQAAAELLWERRQGRLQGPPQLRQVAMRLISRLTSHPDWSFSPAHAALVGGS